MKTATRTRKARKPAARYPADVPDLIRRIIDGTADPAPQHILRREYEGLEEIKARVPNRPPDPPRVVAEGLTAAQARAFIAAVYGRISLHPRMNALLSGGTLCIAWWTDSDYTPAESVGFQVEVWATSPDGETWTVVDRTRGYGRLPYLSGYGWLPADK